MLDGAGGLKTQGRCSQLERDVEELKDISKGGAEELQKILLKNVFQLQVPEANSYSNTVVR